MKNSLSIVALAFIVAIFAGCATTTQQKTMTYEELKANRPASLKKVGEPKIDKLSSDIDSLQANMDAQTDGYITQIKNAKEYKKIMQRLATTEEKNIPTVVGNKAGMLFGVIKKINPEQQIAKVNSLVTKTGDVATSATELGKSYSSFSLDPKIINRLKALNAIKSKVDYTKQEATYLTNEYSLMLKVMNQLKK